MSLNLLRCATTLTASSMLLAAETTPPAPAPAPVEPAPTWGSFWEALTKGTPKGGASLRLETVDQDGISEEATALNVEVHLSYQTKSFHDTTLLVEFEGIEPLIKDFNDGFNGKTEYPLVADPNIAEFNRYQLQNTSIRDTTLTLGRQRLIWDNQRWVGNVGWRLNEQTYDGLRVENASVENLAIDGFLLTNVNLPNGLNWTMDSGLLGNVAYTFANIGKLSGYIHMLDFNEKQTPQPDSATMGVRFAGSRALAEDLKVRYTAELAQQSDYADRDDFSASYWHLLAGIEWKGYTFSVGYELLGSDDGEAALQTPLATKHAFQGWADKFLNTPAAGLSDLYLQVDVGLPNVPKLKGTLAYHVYESDEDSIDYGDELNVLATWKGTDLVTFGGKLASYSADDFATDTTKFWLWTALEF